MNIAHKIIALTNTEYSFINCRGGVQRNKFLYSEKNVQTWVLRTIIIVFAENQEL